MRSNNHSNALNGGGGLAGLGRGKCGGRSNAIVGRMAIACVEREQQRAFYVLSWIVLPT